MPRDISFRYKKAEDSAGFLLWKITALWQAKLAKVLRQYNITQSQYAILASLKWFEENKEPTTQSNLVDHTKIEKMTVSKAIRKLEKNEIVLRSRSSTDNRATNVMFTYKGKALIKKAIVSIERADEEFFSCLSEKQLEVYKKLTSKIILDNGL